ncbi:alpha-amylase family glycosyl hydrolase [Spirochaeta africana]|uniref:Pullulanase-like glycosidase possibly secreted by type II secretory pathway n=1 Tax=Spirochaeta africana (strain ATCC 700263 / DSM 8902 / Z-7692) TaxID=889378 RepID=H9UIB0_SPIAZ|nr:alpha-amylase family glycosyl hydrolase [Spirochaeta africana]AFG37253.1 pullulanase-like glycosidase possibly secreted by type II secretory pathway [Spirochaeta africana DSM 8902]
MFSFDESYEPYPVPDNTHPLGCSYRSGAAVFSLWSPDADDVLLHLYHPGESEPTTVHRLQYNPQNGVWSSAEPVADCLGMAYTYVVARHGHKHECLDPYAIAMEPTRLPSDRQLRSSGRGIVVDPVELAGYAAAPMATAVPPEQTVIYEVHVRDFTIAAATDAKPGTFAAFRERIPYLQDLGITHVQLLPVWKSAFIDEMQQAYEHTGRTHGNNYNWGYDPQNYFSVNGWLSTDPTDPTAGIRELASLINDLHQAGIGVIFDVVYNHMGDARFLEDIVPHYFFRRDIAGEFTSNSGCGNDIASCRQMARRLIHDSLCYIAETFGADGFRFDLMGLIDSETILQAKHTVQQKTGRQLLFLGEGWRMYNGPEGTRALDQDFLTETDEVAVFSDELRDLLKAGGLAEEGNGFVTDLPVDTRQLYHNLVGDPQNYFRSMTPGCVVNYIAAHDGLTLHDSIIHNSRLDPGNPQDRESLRRRILMANFLLLTSQGITFLHAGQERGRSKHIPSHQEKCIGQFVHDSYNSDDRVNQFVWELDEWQQQLLTYTRSLIHLRRSEDIFAIGDHSRIYRAAEYVDTGVGTAVAYGLRKDRAELYLIMANAAVDPVTIALPDQLCGIDTHTAQRTVVVDTARVSADGIERPEGLLLQADAVTLEGLSWTMLRVGCMY